MSDRRHYRRFVVGDGAEGTFRSLEDVNIEKVDDDELLISTVAPATPGETLTVEIYGEEDQRESVITGEVTECRPIVTDGTLRHRVVVRVKERQEGGGSAGPQGASGSKRTK